MFLLKETNPTISCNSVFEKKRLVLTKWGLFLLSFSFFVLFGTLGNWHLSRDAIGYLNDAEKAAEGCYYFVPRGQYAPPLLVMIMVHLNHWFGVPCKVTGLLFCIICGSMCSAIIFSGIYKLFCDYYLAALSAVLFFLIPGIRDVSVDILRDAPSLCMNLAGIHTFILYRKTGALGLAVACGFFLILAFCFRFENIEFLFLIPAFNIFLDLIGEHISFVSLWKKNLLFIFCCIAGIISGFILVKIVCLNCNYYSSDKALELIQRYIYVE